MSAPPLDDRGVTPFEPMSVRELCRRTYSVVRGSPLATAGSIAAVTLVIGIFSVFARIPVADPAGPGYRPDSESRQVLITLGLWPGGAVLGTAMWFSGALCSFGMVAVVVARALFGHRTSARQAWRATRPRLAALVGLALIDIAVFLVPLVVCSSLAILFAEATGPGPANVVALALGGVAFLAMLLLMPTVVLSPQAVVLERSGPITGFRRAVTLQRRGFPRLFALVTAVNLSAFAVSVAFVVPFMAAAVAIAGGPASAADQPVERLVFASIGWVASQILTLPFSMSFYSLLYTDQRIRYEGFAAVLRAEADGGPSDRRIDQVWRAPVPGSS
ncbi:hypothetical protein [Tsukamurella sp. 1534]|uniref:hypothetical protein n=1 Tax=Tsukamurella sp. 1534 TaxID=1151061 RepID=UPI000314280A|nr:hypothetical protein [Tsukamurella sp. 1534]